MNPKQLAFAAASATSLLVVGLAFARNTSDTPPRSTPGATVSATFSASADTRDLLAGARDGSQWQGDRAWQLAIDRLSADEFPAVLAEIADLPDPKVRASLRRTVFARWAELSPATAAIAVTTLPTNEGRIGFGSVVFVEWLHVNPSAALAWAAREPEFSLRQWEAQESLENSPSSTALAILAALDAKPAGAISDEIREAAFTRLVATEPNAAIAYTQRQPLGRARDLMLTQALAALAGQDPAAALARATNLPDAQRQTVLAAATSATAARDPLEALALLEQLPAGPARLEAAKSVIAGLAREDPNSAVEFALTFPAGRMRENLLSSVANALASADAPAALRWLQALPADATRESLINEVSWQLVRADSVSPSTAANFALSLTAGYRRASAFAAAVERMAKQDLAATAAWLQTINDTEVRPAALRSLAEAWPQSDITGAFTYAQRLTADADRQEFLSRLGHSLAEHPTAAACLAQLPAGPARDAFAHGIIDNRLSEAPAAAALIVDAMSPGESRNYSATRIARSWAQSDPTAAARWVETRADLAADATTCAAVVDGWAQWDPEGAAAWLARLPAGAGRAGAAFELVDELKTTAPATAARWTSEIADAEQRHRAIARLAAPWLAADRPTAAAWLARTDLPRETQQALLEGRPVPNAEDEDVIVLSPFMTD